MPQHLQTAQIHLVKLLGQFAYRVQIMKTSNRLMTRVMTLGVLAALLGLSGCIIDREHAHGRYDDQRHDRHDGQRDDDRAERRDHDNRCAGRDHEGDCHDEDR